MDLGAPLVVFGSMAYKNYIKEVHLKYNEYIDMANFMAMDIVNGIKMIKSFGRELNNSLLDKHIDFVESSFSSGNNISQVQAIFSGTAGFFPQIATVLVLYFGVVFVLEKDLTIGMLTSFLFYSVNLALTFGIFNGISKSPLQILTDSKNLMDILDRVPDIPLNSGAKIETFEGKLEFQNVSFSYKTSEHPILKNCSFKVSPGETFIIAGDFGSGKTTLLNLISRFYNVSSGRILFDGTVDLLIINPEWLRKVVGIIPQNPIFLHASIKENLLLCLPKDRIYVESDIIEASKEATAHDFIKNLPYGYNTIIGGSETPRLDNHQKTKLALLQVLLCNPKLLLVDGSSMDSELQSLILTLFKGKTIIMTVNSHPNPNLKI